MKKIHITSITFLLSAALLLGGCAERGNTPAQGADTNSGSVSSDNGGSDPDSSISDFSSSLNSSTDISSSSSRTPSSESSSSAENPEPQNEPVLPIEEVKQILKPLREYGDLCWKMFPFDINRDLVDMEQIVSSERLTNFGMSPHTFYKVVNGDIQTEEQFIAKLDTMLTEKMKKTFLENPERPFELFEGSLYINGRGAGGMGSGMDALYLDSIKYTDENTVSVTVTSFGNKEKWGGTKDIRDKATATLIKTDDGFRIETCDDRAAIDFYYYKEIIYNGETITL